MKIMFVLVDKIKFYEINNQKVKIFRQNLVKERDKS
jgi:hypothetical protein